MSRTDFVSVEIRDVLGCARADLDLAPIALVAGPNEAGKSSIAVAVGMTAAGLPLWGCTRSQAKDLVRDGATAGRVTISPAPERVVEAYWPAAKITTSGQPLRVSRVSAGLITLVDMPPEERVEFLIALLGAEPTRADLDQAIEATSDPASIGAEIWDTIVARGWEAAEREWIEKRAVAKAAWGKITGKKYGPVAAANWRHDDWTKDCDSADPEDLELSIAEINHTIKTLEAEQSVDAAEVERLRARRDEIPTLGERVSQAKAELASLEAERTRLESERDAFLAARAKLTVPVDASRAPLCPHCGKPVEIESGKILKKAQVRTNAEIKAAWSEIAQADGNISNRRDAITVIEHKITAAVAAVATAETRLKAAQADAAALRLAEMRGAGRPEAATDLIRARDERDSAVTRLRVVTETAATNQHHRTVLDADFVVDAVKPAGVRRRVLARCLARFNDQLDNLSRVAGWRPTSIDLTETSVEVRWNGKPLRFAAESARWRAAVVVQVAAAVRAGDDILIFDRADVLVGSARNGLFSLLRHVALPALVCMSAAARADVPDLAEYGLGKSYWISKDHVSKLIGEA